MNINPLAGKLASHAMLVNVARLITAYYTDVPDPSVPEQRIAFGTSGHRGSAFERSFNEWHVLAITQAICRYRKQQSIDGPLFLGIDTHALSEPACASALEGFAARPSGTEDMYKIYAESFRDEAHLTRIVDEAQTWIDDTLETKTAGRDGAVQ